jgi:site-specific DNA-methyltransferase (adenine-specific)
MRWLVRLTTPPGGTVLDPFMGSGTTGAAACGQGFDFIGADLSARFVAIAHERIRHSAPGVEIDAPQEAVEILGETDSPTLWDTLGARRGPEGVERD